MSGCHLVKIHYLSVSGKISECICLENFPIFILGKKEETYVQIV